MARWGPGLGWRPARARPAAPQGTVLPPRRRASLWPRVQRSATRGMDALYPPLPRRGRGASGTPSHGLCPVGCASVLHPPYPQTHVSSPMPLQNGPGGVPAARHPQNRPRTVREPDFCAPRNALRALRNRERVPRNAVSAPRNAMRGRRHAFFSPRNAMRGGRHAICGPRDAMPGQGGVVPGGGIAGRGWRGAGRATRYAGRTTRISDSDTVHSRWRNRVSELPAQHLPIWRTHLCQTRIKKGKCRMAISNYQTMPLSFFERTSTLSCSGRTTCVMNLIEVACLLLQQCLTKRRWNCCVLCFATIVPSSKS